MTHRNLFSTTAIFVLGLAGVSACIDDTDVSELEFELEDAEWEPVHVDLDRDAIAFEEHDQSEHSEDEDGEPLGGGALDLDTNDPPLTPHLQQGTDTTSFSPVVRIETAGGGTCTATAISDDVLATAAHCIKSGNSVTDYVKVRKAHGNNASAQGRYSSYFMLSSDIYNNVTVNETMGSNYASRDFAFIKFGEGTFSSYYELGEINSKSELEGESVRLIGFGGNDTKSYGDDIVTGMTYTYSGEYAYANTNNTNGVTNVEKGDSGGPMLKVVNGQYQVVGVLYGNNNSSYHSVVTDEVYEHVYPVIWTDLAKYCAEAYEHANYGGWGVSFCHRGVIDGRFSADSFNDTFMIESHWNYGHWNDEVTSMSVPENMMVTLHQHSGGSGWSVTYQDVLPFITSADVPSLADIGFNDMASSFTMSYTTGNGLGKSYHLEQTQHRNCVDLAAGNTANRTNFQMWDCQQGNTNQIFKLEQVGSYYRIKHVASGKCLDASISAAPNVYLYQCTSGDNQLFSVEVRGETADVRDFRLRNKHFNTCLDVKSNSSSNGANVQLWSCNGTGAQNFALRYW